MISSSEFSTILLRSQHSPVDKWARHADLPHLPLKAQMKNKKFSKRMKIATKINAISCYRFTGFKQGFGRY